MLPFLALLETLWLDQKSVTAPQSETTRYLYRKYGAKACDSHNLEARVLHEAVLADIESRIGIDYKKGTLPNYQYTRLDSI